MNGIVIIINLQGRIGKRVAHSERQSVTYKFTDKEGKTRFETKEIVHNDREQSNCYKRTIISDSILNQWINGPAPSQFSNKLWKKLNSKQKIELYVSLFDEGYGVSFEELT